jgi:hypothetical protein
MGCRFVLVGAFAAAAYGQARDRRFPDSAYVSPGRFGHPELGRAVSGWIAMELRGAHEPPLEQRETDHPLEVYRYSRLLTWGGIESVRLERRDSTWQLTRKRTARVAGATPSSRTLRRADSAVASADDASTVISTIAASARWRRPAPACGQGEDGTSTVLEARDRDGYAMVYCWEPDSERALVIVATVRSIVELARRTFGADGS